MWKFLRHPNILPLIGVSILGTRFVMVSEWMENGNINEFAKAHPNADRLGLVGSPTGIFPLFALVTIGKFTAGGCC